MERARALRRTSARTLASPRSRPGNVRRRSCGRRGCCPSRPSARRGTERGCWTRDGRGPRTARRASLPDALECVTSRTNAAESAAELDGPPGHVAVPERHVAAGAGRGRDEHTVVADLLDEPARCPEHERVAGPLGPDAGAARAGARGSSPRVGGLGVVGVEAWWNSNSRSTELSCSASCLMFSPTARSRLRSPGHSRPRRRWWRRRRWEGLGLESSSWTLPSPTTTPWRRRGPPPGVLDDTLLSAEPDTSPSTTMPPSVATFGLAGGLVVVLDVHELARWRRWSFELAMVPASSMSVSAAPASPPADDQMMGRGPPGRIGIVPYLSRPPSRAASRAGSVMSNAAAAGGWAAGYPGR